ncbi:uncharacterized protein LOC132741227 [Ruditapes philippinarum]|uniref:uncharacterized protein LOC132741227 n=1 Tax=Ruditapes philippinarum TaxID=129788 RepID=UPI00295A79AC|nr:uncharacterized protein LOC132741227 [Ruditapes philippinarum]
MICAFRIVTCYRKMKYAVFGDSYISRLERYTHGKLEINRQCKFFGVPGMSTTKKFQDAFEQLLAYRPRYVFLNLGGNSFIADCNPHTVYLEIIDIVDKMYKAGVQRVFVASIIERGKFPHWTGLNRSIFNKMRNSVNSKLKKYYREDFIQIGKRLKFDRHYDDDKVYPGLQQGGLKLFKYCVLNALKKTL